MIKATKDVIKKILWIKNEHAINKIFYKFLINSEKPIIIRITKIVFLSNSLDNLILILVPKYCPNKAGTVIIRLTNKS